jgi:putative membrane protein
MKYSQRYPLLFSFCTLSILCASLVLTRHTEVWVMEVFPILVGFPILFFTYQKFRFTTLIYVLLVVHFAILSVGGIYTYAEVPLGYWMQDWLGFTRNNYDKIGHFAQGFIPAMLTRELLLRTSPLQRGKWLSFLVVAVCVAASAMYELLEWWTAVVRGDSAEEFLGLQGYAWDAQSDMLLALLGAVAALLALAKIHDAALAKIGKLPA